VREKFNQSFKIQAVEKALNRDSVTTLKALADSLGVGYSTLQTWIRKSRNPEFEMGWETELMNRATMSKEKRPQDWNQEEKLKMVIACAPLSEEAVNKLCREKGLYAHHVHQWEVDFLEGKAPPASVKSRGEIKSLRMENKTLKKELHRKEKALAETAALLVLKKK